MREVDVGPVSDTCVGPLSGFARGMGGKRLHRLTKTGPGPALLAALAAHLRRQPIEFAVKTVRGRGEQVVVRPA